MRSGWPPGRRSSRGKEDELTGEIASQAADYEERLAARTEEFAREKHRLTDQMASLGEDYAERLDGQAADYEERLAARTEEFAREKDRLSRSHRWARIMQSVWIAGRRL